jgi:hypothetical protein
VVNNHNFAKFRLKAVNVGLRYWGYILFDLLRFIAETFTLPEHFNDDIARTESSEEKQMKRLHYSLDQLISLMQEHLRIHKRLLIKLMINEFAFIGREEITIDFFPGCKFFSK